MKVLLVNGSPHKAGCTYTALCEVAGALEREGMETEIFHIGTGPVRSCAACGGCARTRGVCAFTDDCVNTLIEKAAACDGLVIGSPVHYASASGAVTAVMDRLFYAGAAAQRGKPGAAVVSCRRAGSTAALDQLQKYFPIAGMPLVPSQYWPMIHGSCAEEARQDAEGMQTMRVLGRNMAWMLKCFALGREHGVEYPAREEKRVWTNFIR